jgi:hypothetical protein
MFVVISLLIFDIRQDEMIPFANSGHKSKLYTAFQVILE